MNESQKDSLGRIMEKASPPAVTSQQWEAVWRRVIAPPDLALPAVPRRSWLRGLAYAAIFLAGVSVGLYATRLGDFSAPAPVPTIEQPTTIEGDPGASDAGRPMLASLSGESSSDGVDIEMLGLQNVKVETIEEPEQGTVEYRMTAVTPRGVKIVWNYPAGELAASSDWR